MQPYFIFKNISSDDMGVIINKLPSFFIPEREIEKIEIQGRDGFLTNDLGTYKSTLKSIECTIKNTDNLESICSWLTGIGDLILSTEPNKIYNAVISNKIEFKKILREYRNFIIEFECQPYAKDVNSNNSITLINKGNVLNATNATAKPIIKIFGTGNINLNVNNITVNLTGIDGYITINSELMDCYKDTLPYNNKMAGDFPVFNVGMNIITTTGTVTKIEITPNWRWL